MMSSQLSQSSCSNILDTHVSQSAPLESTYYRPNGAGGVYWKFVKGRWVSISIKRVETALKESGFCPFADTKQGEVTCDLERELYRIDTECRVFYAGPLAGYKMGLYEFEGEPALVTRSMELIEPKAGKWDVLGQVFAGAFAQKNDHDQRMVLFGWWRHVLQALYTGRHSPGLALVLAGERESGKSLLAELIKETLGKRFAQPYAWMTGRDNFNEEIFESTLQLIDDENASTRLDDRLRFGAALKQMVAVPGARCRGLHQKANTLRPLWRLLICLNMEPDRLMVLPPLDDDVEDKMLILKACRSKMPMPAETADERLAFWRQLTGELPAFIHYLLHEFELPRELAGRFGVRFWHHPDVVRELRAVSPEQQVLEFIERYFRRKTRLEWSGSPSELRQLLLNDAGLSDQESREVPKAAWLGRRLAKLMEQWPDHYSVRRETAGMVWNIQRISPMTTDYETTQI